MRNVLYNDNPSSAALLASRVRDRSRRMSTGLAPCPLPLDGLLKSVLQEESPSRNWSTLPRVYRFRRQREDWLSSDQQILNTLALSKTNPFAHLDCIKEDLSFWGSGVFATPRSRVLFDWDHWCSEQLLRSQASPSQPMKLIQRAMTRAFDGGSPHCLDFTALSTADYLEPVIYAAGFHDERAIYVGYSAHSLVERTKLRWHRRGHADALTRKVAIRAADFKSKFYAIPLMSISHCLNDKDSVAALERVWILNLGTLANGLNVVLPIDQSIWIADRPGRWLLDPKSVRFSEIATKINGVLQSSFHQVTAAGLAGQFDFLSANRSRTVLRWLELYPDPSDSIVATISEAIVLARGRLTASFRRRVQPVVITSPVSSSLPLLCSTSPLASSLPTGLHSSPADSDSLSLSHSLCNDDSDHLSDLSDPGPNVNLFLKIPYLSSVVEARSVRGIVNSELSRSLTAGLFEPSHVKICWRHSPPLRLLLANFFTIATNPHGSTCSCQCLVLLLSGFPRFRCRYFRWARCHFRLLAAAS